MTILSTNLAQNTENFIDTMTGDQAAANDLKTLLRILNRLYTTDFVAGIGAAAASGNVASEAFGVVNKTLLTLTAVGVTMADATVQGGGTKIYDFPAGQILILGSTASLAPKTTTALASTINASAAGVWSLGSAVAAANATLTSTEADVLPSTAFTSSATINVAAATVTGALAAPIIIDGRTTAVDLYLNACIDTATDIDGDGTITWTGTVLVHWINLGDT